MAPSWRPKAISSGTQPADPMRDVDYPQKAFLTGSPSRAFLCGMALLASSGTEAKESDALPHGRLEWQLSRKLPA